MKKTLPPADQLTDAERLIHIRGIVLQILDELDSLILELDELELELEREANK